MATYFLEFTERPQRLDLTRISNTRPVSGDCLQVEAEEVDIAPLRTNGRLNIIHNYMRHLIENARAKGEPLKVWRPFFNAILGRPRDT